MSGLAALDAIREGKAAKAMEPWSRMPFMPINTSRIVLAFDPSLSKTGWAIVSAYSPFVLDTGMCPTQPLDGEEGNLQRGVSIFNQTRDVMSHAYRTYGYRLVVAHEAPPAASGGLYRTDATKSAGLAIRIAADTLSLPIYMVSDTHAKNRMTGRSKEITKAHLKVALEEFWPHLPTSKMRWNEDIRDAVIVGILTHEEFSRG